jgi:hypothetical protein
MDMSKNTKNFHKIEIPAYPHAVVSSKIFLARITSIFINIARKNARKTKENISCFCD